MSKYGRSKLWEHNNETKVTENAAADLTGFKSSGVNYKLALWDPQVNGVRYLKALIYNLAMGLSQENLARLRRIANRDVGDPITVRCHGETVCMDYLQAVLELEFVSGHVELDGARVLEIGAGYGRTCHAMLSNHEIDSYTIIDLDNSLQLARGYLNAVLTADQFAKIRFVPVRDLDEVLADARFDLCVNIDSFAEMDPATVAEYLGLIAEKCRLFYANNPVGKYLDRTLDDHSQGADVVAFALSAGPLRDVIDIHDSQEVEAKVEKFVDAYRPGDSWRHIADARTAPWSYYWQALYRDEGAVRP